MARVSRHHDFVAIRLHCVGEDLRKYVLESEVSNRQVEVSSVLTVCSGAAYTSKWEPTPVSLDNDDDSFSEVIKETSLPGPARPQDMVAEVDGKGLKNNCIC